MKTLPINIAADAQNLVSPVKSDLPNIKTEIGNFLSDLKLTPGKQIKADFNSAKDLLNYQIKASNYHLRVEILSKASESVLATARKLEQQ